MKKLKICENTPSDICKFRKSYTDRGLELVDITHLCTFKLGDSGWCNNFNEPDENLHHIKVFYRDEEIGIFGCDDCYAIDESEYTIWKEEGDAVSNDFIVFKVCKKL